LHQGHLGTTVDPSVEAFGASGQTMSWLDVPDNMRETLNVVRASRICAHILGAVR
jgi:hypothetical protein